MMLNTAVEADRPSEAGGHLEGVLLVSDIPPCLNYSGGIFIDRILASIDYRIRHGFIVLNPHVKPALSEAIAQKLSFETVSKPNELYCPEVSSAEDIRRQELRAQRHVRDVILPSLLRFAADRSIGGFWVVLEGQSMIRLACALLRATDLPVTVQVMDPPQEWMRAHGVDDRSREEILEQYEDVLRHARACATTSWSMAERYAKDFGTPCFPVVPSLPESLARRGARRRKQRRSLRIGLAGQIYARQEWDTLMSAVAMRTGTRDEPIEVHVFTNDPVDDRGPGVREGFLGLRGTGAALAKPGGCRHHQWRFRHEHASIDARSA